MNLKDILGEKSQKAIHSILFHLYDFMEKAKLQGEKTDRSGVQI